MAMSRLCSRLFVGGIKDAERLAADNSAGITAVISLCAEEIVTKRRDVRYVRIAVEHRDTGDDINSQLAASLSRRRGSHACGVQTCMDSQSWVSPDAGASAHFWAKIDRAS